MLERALAINETALGEGHPTVGSSLNGLAALYQVQGNYTAALPLYERALVIGELALGEDHPDVANSLSNLATLYQAQGNYTAALPLLERALTIRELTLGEDHPDVASSLNNLALLYQEQGNYTAALPLYERALAINETALGEDHPAVAVSLNNLAVLYQVQGNYTAALPLLERALKIRELTLGEDHPAVAIGLNNLASLYKVQGNYTAALSLLERALAINETALGEGHPTVGSSLNNLAALYQVQGNYTAALPLYEQALAINRAALGEQHSNIASSLNSLALLFRYQDNIDHTIELLTLASEIEEKNLSDTFSAASEIRRQRYINTLSYSTSVAVTTMFESGSYRNEANRLALTTVLRRKGRVLDTTANSLQRLRTQLTPENQDLLNQLSNLRSQLTTLQFSVPSDGSLQQYQSELRQLEAKAAEIEETLSRSSTVFQLETEPVSIEAVQPLIPTNAALIEFVRYSPDYEKSFEGRSFRYAALVLTEQGTVQSVDLGDAIAIDQKAIAFQKALSTRAGNTKAIARELDTLLMSQLRPLLGDKTHLLLSPDSQLNLIPFDALIDENNNYLIERYQISYLTSGRDLLKLQLDTPSKQNAVILANPNYDSAVVPAQSVSSGDGQRSVDMTNLTFSPLPGTAEEASAIATFLPNATLYTQNQATENSLKQVNAPSILHIATHGFFLPDVPFTTPAPAGERATTFESTISDEAQSQPTPSNLENPLLRSGLVFAGVNARDSGTEDGIFTALEASSLNLLGTQLVVLSACETGIGAASNGEGVYGLRRAFTIAGAESQIMSLWRVNDTGTSELMRLYYENLMGERQGRSEALRNAQLEMLNSGGTFSDPYYWSSFIFSGDWHPVDM